MTQEGFIYMVSNRVRIYNYGFVFYPILFCALNIVPISSASDQILKRHVHPNVHRSTVYHSQDMEAT